MSASSVTGTAPSPAAVLAEADTQASLAAATEKIVALARRAKDASRQVARLSPEARGRGLLAIARAVRETRAMVLAENALDVEAARAAGTSEALVDRLALNDKRIDALADSVLAIAAQPDPVGEVLGLTRRPSGILVGQVRVPLGVVAMIYEARPNVTVDAAALTWKAGNAVILRGGSDARRSNVALGQVVQDALRSEHLPVDAVQIVPPLSREETKILLAQTGLVDLVIPRGGAGLIRFVTDHARVPVIQHFEGICHVFVDEGADVSEAIRIIEDGKARRPGACNATECVLVHEAIAAALLPALVARLRSPEVGVEVRGCERTQALVPDVVSATADDFGREFLDRILAVRVVPDFETAVAHIDRYGSGHTEAIVTPNYARSQRFLREIDASCVLVNASTRFNDGGELGLGAEIGISTSKLHAYGPMGAIHLTTAKWIVYGEGEIRGLSDRWLPLRKPLHLPPNPPRPRNGRRFRRPTRPLARAPAPRPRRARRARASEPRPRSRPRPAPAPAPAPYAR
jgi:glutamate-5-semialdehyde dehydrogenase